MFNSHLLVDHVLHPPEAIAKRRVDGGLHGRNLVVCGAHRELQVVGRDAGLDGELQRKKGVWGLKW